MMSPKKIAAGLLAVAVFILPSPASDESAAAIYQDGHALYMKGEYYDAAKKFEECAVEAASPTIKYNSLVARQASYFKCGLYYREFLIIEQLLQRYPEFLGENRCKELIQREFAIGDWFNNGGREPSFWFFRWVPFWKDVNRMEEILQAALKRAPYSQLAPRAHMLLAIYYDSEGKRSKSLDELRLILTRHPAAPETKYAMLALANGVFENARKGDGAGEQMEEAKAGFKQFIERYQNASEKTFAENKLAEANDVQAERMYDIACFYHRRNHDDAAIRYLSKILNDYPDSVVTVKAEKMLAELDRTYLPRPKFPERPAPRLQQIYSYELPAARDNELISPLTADTHYLLPVPNISGELNDIKSKESENK